MPLLHLCTSTPGTILALQLQHVQSHQIWAQALAELVARRTDAMNTIRGIYSGPDSDQGAGLSTLATPFVRIAPIVATAIFFAALSIASQALAQGQHSAVACLLYTSPSPRDATLSRMPSSA